jgi:mono/diheme cytochrome c family protein
MKTAVLLASLGGAAFLSTVIATSPVLTAQSTPAPAPVPVQAMVTAEQREALMRDGQLVYGRDCAECHADGGIGGPFAGKTVLNDKDRVITRILLGATDGSMEAFGPTLSDRDVAAVATFIRNTWDNTFGPVVEADVKRIRAALPKKG